MAQHGVVMPIVECDAGDPHVRVVTRGFVPLSDNGTPSLARQLQSTVSRTLAGATDEERQSPKLLGARIDAELNRLFRRETHQRPLVLSTVLER
jgi:mRNA degradation ribonuclease J1/J2